MKKTLLIFSLMFVAMNLYAEITINTLPALNMGSAIYVTDSSGKASVSITNYKTGAISTTNGGPLGSLTGSFATGATFIDMNTKRKYVYVQLVGGDSGTVTGSCGVINITGMSINGATMRNYKVTSATDLYDLPNGIFISMTASFSGTPTSSCTISGAIEGVTLQYKNSNNPNHETWHDANIMVSLDILVPNYLVHDTGAKLNFGSFCSSDQTQTLTVTPAGTVGSSSVVCPISNDISADSFTFTSADMSAPFSVNLPAGSVSISNGTDSLSISNFTSSCTSCTTTGGQATFTIGATITVPGGVSSGDYTGNYPVSVTY
ncbi:MAG: DUF4402 domain-containing protein [Elusimicrobiaceae bacterium]|nr:DUF4402 domain-containing protein [Elusimicrobiaceae bacterium]